MLISAFVAAHAASSPATALPPMLPLQAAKINGFLHPASARTAGTMFDVYYGPFCEDSKRMYATTKSLGDAYGKKLHLRTHIFPLPYNQVTTLWALLYGLIFIFFWLVYF